MRVSAALVLVIAVVWFVGFVVFVGGLTRSPDATPAADGIVVLTGGDTRLSEAMSLLAQKKGKRLLISGVNPSIADTEVRRLLNDSNGLFDCCIDLDRSATNTTGNAEEAALWARRHGYSSLILVTSNYHMPRSLLEFERAMPEVELTAFPIRSDSIPIEDWWRRQGTAMFLASEYNKYLISWLRTRLLSVA